MLFDLQERLQKLENIYDKSVAEKNKLESNINITELRLKRSNLLVVALSGEQNRWENNIKVFYHNICVKVLTYILFGLYFRCFLNCY